MGLSGLYFNMAYTPAHIQTLSGATPTWEAIYKFAKILAVTNVSITIAGADTPDAGCLHFKQDEVGTRTLSINGTAITVNTTPGSLTQVTWAFDGEDYTYHTNVQGGTSGGTLTQLATPQNFTATPSGTNIILSWSDVTGEFSYLLEVSANGTSGWSTVASKAAGSTGHTHAVGSAGVQQFYRLTAVGDGTTYSNSGYATANATTEAGATYTPPLDSVTAAAAYSFRKLRTAHAGALIRVRRVNDDAETDVMPNASGVVAGDSTVSAGGDFTTWLQASFWNVVKFYDQSGNANDATQATKGQQPDGSLTGLNSKPTADFKGLCIMGFTPVFSGAGARSMLAVWKNKASGTFVTSIAGSGNAAPRESFYLQSRTQYATGHPYGMVHSDDLTDNTSPNTTTPILGTFQYNGTDAFLRSNGTQIHTKAVALNTSVSAYGYIGASNGADFADALISEVILTTNYVSGTALTDLENNIKTFWGL
jgi:hypothetical protein